jgi:SAM-dependent methyltransferase
MRLYVLQTVVFVAVLTFFFLSMKFYVYYALLWAVVFYMITALLFKALNVPFFILPQIRGPVFVPSDKESVEQMLSLAKIKEGELAADLGAGDGRVVVALAKAGANVHGIELNPDMVKIAEATVQKEKLKNAKIYWQSFWDLDFGIYDVITIYGFPSIMADLEGKLRSELKPGARVISNRYPFPHWNHVQKVDDVYLYIQK